jgi:D-alanyl-D-alanine carboxypeptidase
LVLALVAGTDTSTPSNSLLQGPAPFRGEISRIDSKLAAWMTGRSWRPGCPVGLGDLRRLTLSYRRFDGTTRVGRLVAHADVASELVDVFRTLYRARFPIRRMVPVDAYGGSDFRSIEADNTSAFNCRFVEGTGRWSEHAYGRAIDVNPIENPYVSSGRTAHRGSEPYLDRARRRPGMAYEGGILVRAFDAVGWGWGGRWTSVKDYQHFSASGR